MPRTVVRRVREERDRDTDRPASRRSSVGAPAPPQMQVRKRNGDLVDVDVNKIVRAVDRYADDLSAIDPLRVATKTISGLYDGATTAELDRLSIQTAAELLAEEPEYSRLAARLLAGYIDKEVRGQGIASFSQSVAAGRAEGLIGDDDGGVRGRARPQTRRRDRRRQRPPVRILRPADRLRPLSPPPPDHPARRRDTAVLAAAGRVRTVDDAGRGDRVLPADGVARLSAAAHRRCSTPAPRTARCPRATSSTRRATNSTRSTTGTPRSRSCRSSPAASASRGHGYAVGAR